MFDDDDWLGGGHQPPYIPILILLLTLCVSGWATCIDLASGNSFNPCYRGLESCPSSSPTCYYGSGCLNPSTIYCTDMPAYKFEGGQLYHYGSYYYTNCRNNNRFNLSSDETGCKGTTMTSNGSWACYQRCDDECEAKEQECRLTGGTWDADNCECKTCKNDSLWYSDSSCTGPNGAGMYVQSVVKHQIKDCEETTIEMTWQTSSCEKDTTYKCLGTVNGHTVMMRAPSGATFNCEADGSCQFAMNKIASGECGPSPSPNPNSSNSNNSSSSEEQSSSSEEQSSSSEDEPNSSETEQQNSSGSVTVAELPQRLYDSLGAIDASIQWYQPLVNGIYDGVYEISGTAHDMNMNLININESTAGINDKMGSANDYLRQIANKDFSPDIHVGSPDVNIDVSGIQSNQNETRDSLHHTNEILDGLGGKLDDIKGLLGSSGSDTIHVDTSKAPASIDSALKHWGNKSNQTFAAAGLDSSGWGNTNDSAEAATDSVLSRADFFGSLGCDTTGGKKCDGSIIGADGLETATGSMKSTYGELRDSLTNGAFSDSLRLWGNKFTGNGTLTGGGSNSCPSVLSRNYRVDIYKGAGYDFTLGRYLCAPLFGQTTAWSLCRMLLRATIALACMWFLFKCATGFGGGGDD